MTIYDPGLSLLHLTVTSAREFYKAQSMNYNVPFYNYSAIKILEIPFFWY
jgi:hypothetical protein